MTTVWILLAVVLAVGLVTAGLFNGLVRRRNRTAVAWSQIDVELERRHDLIPNLVATVKGYASHESATYAAVTQARTAAVDAGTTADPARIAATEGTLSRSLHGLFAVAENYPQLSEMARGQHQVCVASGDAANDSASCQGCSCRWTSPTWS